MESELTTLMDLDVYTSRGKYVGKTEDVILDVNEKKSSKLAVNNLNRTLKEEYNNPNGVLIPYRWVLAVGDIVITKKLPRDVKLRREEEDEAKEEEEEQETEAVREKRRPKKKTEREGLFEY